MMAGSGTVLAFGLIWMGMLERLFLYCFSFQQNTICHARLLKMSSHMMSKKPQADSARAASHSVLDIVREPFSITNFISETELSSRF